MENFTNGEFMVNLTQMKKNKMGLIVMKRTQVLHMVITEKLVFYNCICAAFKKMFLSIGKCAFSTYM